MYMSGGTGERRPAAESGRVAETETGRDGPVTGDRSKVRHNSGTGELSVASNVGVAMNIVYT